MEQLTQDAETLAFSIYDRFLFSEYVYGPICRDTIRLSTHQREVVESQLLTAEPLIVLCELIPQPLLFNTRPQEFSWEITLQANELYPWVFADHWHVALWDVNRESASLGLCIETIEPYLETMSEWYQRRTLLDHGRGNIKNPTWMFVGQQLANHNKWLVPFERSRSARVLHYAIRTLGIPFEECWFTNAYKRDIGLTTYNIGDLKLELAELQPAHVVAVGSKAAGLLNVVEQAYVHIKHPAYYLRKSHGVNLETDYAQLLRHAVEHWL